ncbi:MAG: MBL fold metallo-hydrolase [Christensenellales bacterium]
MKIKWLGHSCFLLTAEDKTKVLLDPFDETVGYAVPAESADIVLTSHDHFDHGYVKAVKGSYHLINKPGDYTVKNIQIHGMATKHDDKNGSLRGNNIVFKVIIDGVQICHMGDIGHVLDPKQLLEIGKVDVLLIPVGGVFTVDAVQAKNIVEDINPRLVIPMHYKTEACTFKIAGAESFIKILGWDTIYPSKEIEVMNEALSRKILVMDYK